MGSEERGKFLLELYRKAQSLPEKELYEYFLDHAVNVTGSTIGFFHFVSKDQESVILTTWNSEALKGCSASYATHYPIEQAGNWVDCIRVKHPVVYNDFKRSPNQKGLPEGHVEVKRMLSVPVLEKGKVEAVFGVGNKADPYTEDDVVQLDLVANELAKILKQRSTEKELREAKNDWERTFNAVPDLIAILDKDKVVQVNRAMARQLRMTPRQAVGLSRNKYLHDLNFPPEFCPQEKAFEDGKEQTAEIHVPRLGGDFLVTTTPIKDGNGKIVGSVHVARNITELKKAQEVCRQNEQRIADILGSIDDYVYALDVNWNISYISSKAAKDLGFKAEELVGKNFWETFPTFLGTEVETNFRTAAAEKAIRRFEWKTIFVRGCIEFAVFPSVEGITVYGKDITERKEAEEELWHAAERNYLYLEAGDFGASEYDFKKSALFLDDRARCLFELDEDETPTVEGVLSRVNSDDRKGLQEAVNQALTGQNKESFYCEFRVNSVDNQLAWVAFYGKVYFLSEGNNRKPSRIIGVYKNITERKKAEEELRQSEESFSKAFRSSPAALALFHLPDGHAVDINEAFVRLFEYDRDELVGKITTFTLFSNPNDRAKIVSTLTEQGQVRNMPVYFKNKTGKVVDTILSSEKINIRGEEYALTTIVDVTEQNKLRAELENYAKNLEKLVEERTKQLQDQERMAAIGQTAGMVGHDLRNPLQTVAGEIYLAKLELDSLPSSEQKTSLGASLAVISEQVSYMDKIIRDLQSFVKEFQVSKQLIGLKQLINATLLQIELPANVTASVNVDDALTASADPQLLKRVLINLFNNAVQAMPHGGELTVSADKDDKGQVSIAVKDTGVGIAEAIKPKIFLPLFTTKARGQGFGLASCRRVMKAHGGEISFESQEGKGTTFTIRLPPPSE